MVDDFLSARCKLVAATARVVPPFVWGEAEPGKCSHNVRRLSQLYGGSILYSWALSEVGPILLTGQTVQPLYSRWVNHVVWRDLYGNIWEATLTRNSLDTTTAWGFTRFVEDSDAVFDIDNEEFCCPRPAIYVAVRPEGEWTADCLCQAERAPVEAQSNWIDRAIYSLCQVGFYPTTWQLKRVRGQLRHISIMAIA